MSRNRNQRRNANATQKASSSGAAPHMPTSKMDQNVFANLLKELEKLATAAKEYPIKALATVLSFLTSVGGAIRLFAGSKESAQGQYYSPSFLDGVLSFLPGRIMAFFILTMSLGWFISLFGIWLTSRPTEVRNILAHTVTAFGAMLLALSVESIFSEDIRQNPIFFLFLGIFGATASVYIAKTNFRLNTEANMNVIATRASLLVNFACITAGLIVFSQISGLSF